MKKLLLACALGFCLPLAAHAAQITIGASTSGQATFQGTGTGNLNVSLGAITGQGSDTLGGAGTYTMTAFGPKLATSVGSGVWDFAAGVTDTFSYTSTAGNSITETFTFQSVNDGSANPHFAGVDSVTAVSGTAAWDAAFGPVGRGSTFDFAVDSITGSLDTLAMGTGSISSGISSGQVNPNAIAEPSTLAVLAASLLGLGWLRHRRQRSP